MPAGGLVIHFGALFFDPKLEEALPSQAITWLGALYLGFGLGFQQKLFMLEGTLPKTGSRLILALFIITWFGDTAAYFVGSFLGKHKLAPRVSPKKSWEGALGNLGGNLAGRLAHAGHRLPRMVPGGRGGPGPAAGHRRPAGRPGGKHLEAQRGREGFLHGRRGIPGHGGMLDRVDSLVFAAPVLYAYVHFVHGFN